MKANDPNKTIRTLTRAAADDKTVRLTDDHWLTNGHWAIRAPLVKIGSGVADSTLDLLRATYSWATFDTYRGNMVPGIVRELDTTLMQRWALTRLMADTERDSRIARIIVSEQGHVSAIDERYVAFLGLTPHQTLYAAKAMRAADLGPGALYTEDGSRLVMPMNRPEIDPFALNHKSAWRDRFEKRTTQATAVETEAETVTT